MDLQTYKDYGKQLRSRFNVTYEFLNLLYKDVKHMGNSEFIEKCEYLLTNKSATLELTIDDFLSKETEKVVDIKPVRKKKVYPKPPYVKPSSTHWDNSGKIEEKLKKMGAGSWVEAMNKVVSNKVK